MYLQVVVGWILNCFNVEVKVIVVCLKFGFNLEVVYCVVENQIIYVDCFFEFFDFDDVEMVFVVIDDFVVLMMIWKLCKEKKIVVNIVDVLLECDFYFGSVYRDGFLQIMVSINGKGFRLVVVIRKFIVGVFFKNVGNVIEVIGELCGKLCKVVLILEESLKRM